MSYCKIWIHCVWTTYRRAPLINELIKTEIINHIIENALSKDIFIDQLNGYSNHLHALISMKGFQNISDIMRNIKGESSRWINKKNLTNTLFKWQDDFFAISLGEEDLRRTRSYIRNQVQHHRCISLHQEVKMLFGEDNG